MPTPIAPTTPRINLAQSERPERPEDPQALPGGMLMDIWEAVARRLPTTRDYVHLMGTTKALKKALGQSKMVGERLEQAGMAADTVAGLSEPQRREALGLRGLVEHNFERGRCRIWTLHGHESGVNQASFSHDDTRVVTASLDGDVRVWDLAQPDKPLILEGHQDWVNSASFSPDDTRVVTVSDDCTVRV